MTEYTPVHQLRECAQVLIGLPGVEAVDVIDHDARVDGPAIEAVVDGDRVPPRVLRTLAQYDRGIHDVARRGNPTHTVVVAV